MQQFKASLRYGNNSTHICRSIFEADYGSEMSFHVDFYVAEFKCLNWERESIYSS